MVTKTLTEEEYTREEAADRLEELAAALRDGDFDVRVENKTVSLRPPETIAMELGIRESSSILRGERESVTITMDWKRQQ